MSILSTLYSGITGLATNGEAIAVIGDNIANVNTVGFKSSRVEFESLLANLGNKQVGLGARTSGINTSFTQGSLMTTTKPTDLAISGNGFFIASNGSRNYYTRNGQFKIDEEGFLSNNAGLKVQGFQTDIYGNLSAEVSNINLSNVSVVSQASNKTRVYVNLDAGAPTIAGNSNDNGTPANPADDFNTRPFDLTDPNNTSNFSTGLKVYDSQGLSHQLNVYFTRVGNAAGDNRWEWNAVVNTNEVEPAFIAGLGATQAGDLNGVNSTPAYTVVGQGTLEFDGQGRLDWASNGFNDAVTDFAPTDLLPSYSVQFVGGVDPMNNVQLDYGDPRNAVYGQAAGTGLAGTTQFRLPSTTSSLYQNGRAAGSLTDYQFEIDGSITGIFSNGETRTIGQVVLASFENPNGLVKDNGNTFVDSPSSGPPTVGAPGEADRGTIVSNTLEQSNVDLSAQFVSLIQHQRGFQANSRCITTSSDLLAELVNIVR